MKETTDVSLVAVHTHTHTHTHTIHLLNKEKSKIIYRNEKDSDKSLE